MNTFIRMDPTEENKVITAGFLKRVQREVDAVVDCRQVIQPCGSIGVADGNEVSVTILLITGMILADENPWMVVRPAS